MSEAIQGRKLDELVSSRELELGRGNIISDLDLRAFPGDYPVYSSSAKSDGCFGRYGHFMFDEPLITWSVDGGGRFFYRPKHRFSVTNVCGYMRSHSPEIDLPFLFYSLDFQHRFFTFDYQDKAHPSVIRQRYTVPEYDIPTQRRIAEVLRTVDEVIEWTEKRLEKQQAIKQGLLHDLFTRGVWTEEALDRRQREGLPAVPSPKPGHLRPSPTDRRDLYQDPPLGPIPKEWEVKRIGDLANYSNGGAFNADDWKESGLPIIRIQNLNGEEVFNYYQGPVSPRWSVEPGDLLFAWSGTRGTSFGPRIWQGPKGVLNQHIFRVDEKPDLVSRSFLHLLLRQYLGEIVKSAHGFKDSFVHVTRSELTEVHVGLPDLAEQSRIVEIVDAHEDSASPGKLTKLRHLKSALMQDLLTGRVPAAAIDLEALAS